MGDEEFDRAGILVDNREPEARLGVMDEPLSPTAKPEVRPMEFLRGSQTSVAIFPRGEVTRGVDVLPDSAKRVLARLPQTKRT